MPKTNNIWVFFGLIASGKSTLAEAWAKRHDLAYYNSDRLRKELAGISATDKRPDQMGQGLYSQEFTSRTYDEMLGCARQELRSGASVVLDASYQSRHERDRVRELATSFGAKSCFIHCICPEQETKKRLALREKDPNAVSDGRWDIYQIQKERFEMPDELADSELMTIMTDKEVGELLACLDKTLEE